MTDAGKADHPLSWPTIDEEPAPTIPKCPRCVRLEGEYQCAIDEISSVVSRRFPSSREKLRELHKLQDIRDDALKAYYMHKATHKGKPPAVRAARKPNSSTKRAEKSDVTVERG